MDKKIKTWPIRFPTKENPNMEKAVFDWPIVLQYDVKAKYQLISRKFLDMKFFSPKRSLNRPKAARVCIHSINQSNLSISVCFVFRFCSHIFISRSYENRSVINFPTRKPVKWRHSQNNNSFRPLSLFNFVPLTFKSLIINNQQ